MSLGQLFPCFFKSIYSRDLDKCFLVGFKMIYKIICSGKEKGIFYNDQTMRKKKSSVKCLPLSKDKVDVQ